MSPAAIVFMAIGWTIAWGLFLYCFGRILFGARTSHERTEPGEAS